MCMYVGRGVKGPVNYSQLFVLTFMFPVSDLHGAHVLPVLVLVEHPGGGGGVFLSYAEGKVLLNVFLNTGILNKHLIKVFKKYLG